MANPTLEAFFQTSLAVFIELSPWLVLGAVIAAAIHVTLPKRWVQKNLQGRAGVVKAVLLGIPLPLCSCGVIPAGIGLKKDGASEGAAVGFLVSTPQTGVDSAFVTASMLGWPFTLYKIVVAIVMGLIAGGWVDAAKTKASSITDSLHFEQAPQKIDHHRGGTRDRWVTAYAHFHDILQSIWLWVLIGVLCSAAITLWLPQNSFAGSWRSIEVSAIVALFVSLPFYVCATASVPIAAALVGKGMPVAAALVFLIAGPASNLATLGAIGKNFSRRALIIYVTSLMVLSYAFAIFGDRVLSLTLALDPVMSLSHTHDHSLSIRWWHIASAFVLFLCFLSYTAQALKQRWSDSKRSLHIDTKHMQSIQTYAVDGMHCQNCVSRLQNHLKKLPNVRHVHIQRDPDRIHIEGITTQDLEREVQTCGYQLGAKQTPTVFAQ